MINQELLDLIKPKLQEGVSEKIISKELISAGWAKKDIKEGFKKLFEEKDEPYTMYKKIKKIRRNEWLFILFFILVNFTLTILSVGLFSFGLAGAAIGLLAVIGIGKITNYISLGIATLFFVNIFRVLKAQLKVKSIQTGEEGMSKLYKKIKRFCIFFYIVNTVVVILILGSFVSTIKSDAKFSNDLKIKDQQAKEARIKEYPNGLKRVLTAFKETISGTQTDFIGYGIIPNNGDCINITTGSLFNPNLFSNSDINSIFTPKSVIDPNRKNQSVVVSIDAAGPYLRNTRYNNIEDARCFSNQDHYAFQLPSYLEETFPVYYCVDDIHPGVQTSNKIIKGPDCFDFDDTYTPTKETSPNNP